MITLNEEHQEAYKGPVADIQYEFTLTVNDNGTSTVRLIDQIGSHPVMDQLFKEHHMAIADEDVATGITTFAIHGPVLYRPLAFIFKDGYALAEIQNPPDSADSPKDCVLAQVVDENFVFNILVDNSYEMDWLLEKYKVGRIKLQRYHYSGK